MSYHQQPEQGGRRQGPPYPILGANGGAAPARAPAAGVYGMPQYQQAEGYGGPPPSPVVAASWERGYVSGLDEGYMRPDPQGILPATGTPLASGTSGSGETGFLVSGGGANTMGAPIQSYYPPSLYGVPASMYPFPPQAGFHGQYAGGGGAGGAGAAGSTGAGAGSTAAGNFYGQGGYARSTNPGQPIQTTTNLQGPDGCNLFVFHIPNTMTNEALFRLFSKFGNVISARIMVEKATGRSRGFGFVSYDNRDSAEKAISQMNGYQIEHKRLKVQHKKDKERDRYVAAPSPTQRLMGAAGGVGPAGRVQPAPHFRQPLLPQHAALRHHAECVRVDKTESIRKSDGSQSGPGVVLMSLDDSSEVEEHAQGIPGHGDGTDLMPQTPSKVGDDKPPPPSPATEGNTAFAGANAEGDLSDNQASANDVGGIEGAGDPTYSSRATGGEKYGRANDHPHLAYIYRGRGTAQPPDEGVDGQEEGENAYLGAAPAASVGGTRRAASPDPKPGVPRPRSASPSAAANAAAAVAAAAAMPHQSLEHAMQTKLSLGGSGSSPASAQPS